MPIKLYVDWVNATRLGPEKWAVEREYHDFLIDHFGSDHEAFLCRQSFYKAHQPPNHAWHIAVMKARVLATRGLLPSEARTVALVDNFIML